MRKLLVCLLFGLLPGTSAIADTLKIDPEIFETQPGQLISFELNGEISEIKLKSRTETVDHIEIELVFDDPGTASPFAGRLQLTRENGLHFYQYATQKTYQGYLSSSGFAELSLGKLLPANFGSSGHGCYSDGSPATLPSPMLSSFDETRFSLDTDKVRDAEPCTIWELETPVGTLPFLITSVTEAAPAYLSTSGIIVGSESDDYFGRPQGAHLTVYDPCVDRDEGVNYCWELFLNGQISDRMRRDKDIFVTALTTQRANSLDIVVRERRPVVVNLSTDIPRTVGD